jgi:hypothetical protein
MSETEPQTRITVLGTITTSEPGAALVIPAGLTADQIKLFLERAEAERVGAVQRESAALKKMFLPDESKADDVLPPDKPAVQRDWLLP